MEKIIFEQDIYTFHIDFAGHVSNIVYIQWMEIGRLRLLDAVGLPVEKITTTAGIIPTLAATTIRYKKQLFLGDRVRIEVWLSRLKHASAVMEFRFYNQHGELTTSGSQTGLFIDAATSKPHRISDEERQVFSRYLAED
jgi:acyl-CoA thioester hydrolase